MQNRDAGFSLIESLVSVAIVAGGVLGVATLFVAGTSLQVNARDSTTALNLVIAEVERLRMLPPTAVERGNGGSLTANTANHFVVRGTTTLRWTVADGPACGPFQWAGAAAPIECVKIVTVVGVGQNNRAMTPRITTQLWR
jgi:prepilin-type N-terminal cleavage/methylation domain-containing protein